jgi:hypothetical protein
MNSFRLGFFQHFCMQCLFVPVPSMTLFLVNDIRRKRRWIARQAGRRIVIAV